MLKYNCTKCSDDNQHFGGFQSVGKHPAGLPAVYGETDFSIKRAIGGITANSAVGKKPQLLQISNRLQSGLLCWSAVPLSLWFTAMLHLLSALQQVVFTAARNAVPVPVNKDRTSI